MYNFRKKTYEDRAISYCSVPNFAVEAVESHAKLTANAKLIYNVALRWCVRINSTQYDFTIAWFAKKLGGIDRKTVSAAIKQLKHYKLFDDKGILIPKPEEHHYAKVKETASNNKNNNAPSPAPSDDTKTVQDIADTTDTSLQQKRSTVSEPEATMSIIDEARNILGVIELMGSKSAVANHQIQRLKEIGFNYDNYSAAQETKKETKLEDFFTEKMTRQPTGRISLDKGETTHECGIIPHSNNNTNETSKNNNTPTISLASKKPIYNLEKFIMGSLAKLVSKNNIPTMFIEVKMDLERRIAKGETDIRKNLNFLFKLISTGKYNCRYT